MQESKGGLHEKAKLIAWKGKFAKIGLDVRAIAVVKLPCVQNRIVSERWRFVFEIFVVSFEFLHERIVVGTRLTRTLELKVLKEIHLPFFAITQGKIRSEMRKWNSHKNRKLTRKV
jgi:hypothetical protein